MEITRNRWIWFIVLIIISSILIFIFNDREKPPEMVLPKHINETVTANLTQEEINSLKIPECEEDFNYIPARNICYKENPFGHTMVTFTQLLAVVITIGLITVYEFKDWRIYLSSKLLPYKNKYQDVLTPITKSPDTYEKNGFLWTREGFDAIMSGTSNNLYIAKKELTHKVTNNLILKGQVQRVSHAYLYEFTGKNIKFLREITENPLISVTKTGKLLNIDQNLQIFAILPLNNPQELRTFSSIGGHFGFGADRFDIILTALYKMKKGLNGFGTKLNKASESMMGNAKKLSESTANISDAVSRTQKAEIESRYYPPTDQPQGGYDQRRQQL